MKNHRAMQPWFLNVLGVVAAGAVTAGCSCGRVAAHGSSSDPDGERGSGGEANGGSAAGSGGSSGASSGDGGSAGNVTSGGGAGGTTNGGGAGFGGSAGAGMAGSGTAGSAFGGSPPVATGGGPTCEIFEPPPVPNPTDEDIERGALIRDFCATLAREGCAGAGSGFIGHHAAGCSIEQQAIACEQDVLAQYHQWILPPCEEAWRKAIICGAAATYTVEDCSSAALLSWSPSRVEPCEDEEQALRDCTDENSPWQETTGSRTTCTAGPGITSPCEVQCPVGDNYFSLECGGPPGVPMRCICGVNERVIGDFDFNRPSTIYAEDCQDAARRAADGLCTNRLDCCIEYFDGQSDACLCGSDPALLGHATCEAAAESVGGTVVEICPRFEPDPGGCWPPCED